MSDTKHLFGLPHAEQLYDDPGTVWESDIEEWIGHHRDTEWTVEEWTSRPASVFLPDVSMIAETVAEYASDDMGMEGAWPEWESAQQDPAVLAAFQSAMDLMASKVNYRFAQEKIGEHKITLDSNGNPLLNGEPLYVKSVSHV